MQYIDMACVYGENKKSVKVRVNDKVFYPSYGVCIITAIEEVEYLESKVKMCKMYFEKEKMTITIPVNRMIEMGVRAISSKETINKVINNILSKAPKVNKGVWTKRIMELETKVYSGIPTLMADAINSLFLSTKDYNKSYSERLLFEKAKQRLVSEIAVALDIKEEEANKRVMDALAISLSNTAKIKEHDALELENKSSGGDDFNDSDFDDSDDEDNELLNNDSSDDNTFSNGKKAG